MVVTMMMVMVAAVVVVLVGVREDSSLCLRAFAGSLPSGRKRCKLHHLDGKAKREEGNHHPAHDAVNIGSAIFKHPAIFVAATCELDGEP